jgi:multiple sugar transport system substrate-binding protein
MKAETIQQVRDAGTKVLRFTGGLSLAALVVWVLIPPPAPAALHNRIPVHVWHMWSGEWLPVIDNVADQFNKSQDKYEVIPLEIPPGDGDQKFLLSVSGGNPPDVMVQWTQAIDTYAQSGILQPMDTLMTPAESHHFMYEDYPAVRKNGWYKDHLYGMTVGFDVYACYYRPDEWKKAGLDPNKFPATFEELTEDSHKLDQYDAAGNLTRLGFFPQAFTSYAPAFGGSFYDQDTNQVLLDTPQNEAALNYVVGDYQKIGIDKLLRFKAGMQSEDAASWPFIQGQIAVTLDGEWRVKQMAQYAPDMDYQVAALPPAAGGKPLSSFSTADFLTIPAGAKEKEGAWEFIKFWSGLDHPDQAAKFQASFCWLPTSPQMAASPDYQAFLKKYPRFRTFVQLAASPNVEFIPPVPDQLFLNDRIAVAGDLAERGAKSPKQALTSLEDDAAREETRRKGLAYDQ